MEIIIDIIIIAIIFVTVRMLLKVIIIHVLIGKEKKLAEIIEKEYSISDIKKNWDKIPVDLDKCEIKTNNYYMEITPDCSRITALDGLLNSDKGLDKMNIQHSVILYETDRYGTGRQYISDDIRLDVTKLKIILAMHENTHIYVNPADTEEYYFDLEFIFDYLNI